MSSKVLDNVQMAVFTSAESAQYVQFLLLGHIQTSRILQGTHDFRGVGVRRCSCIPIYAPQSGRQAQIC